MDEQRHEHLHAAVVAVAAVGLLAAGAGLWVLRVSLRLTGEPTSGDRWLGSAVLLALAVLAVGLAVLCQRRPPAADWAVTVALWCGLLLLAGAGVGALGAVGAPAGPPQRSDLDAVAVAWAGLLGAPAATYLAAAALRLTARSSRGPRSRRDPSSAPARRPYDGS